MVYFLQNFGDILPMTHILEITEMNTPCQLNTFLTHNAHPLPITHNTTKQPSHILAMKK